MRSSRSSGDRDFPVFPIGPVLEKYGGEPVLEDRGWYAYSCPFGELHSSGDDNSKSASVNTVINVFVCHGCGMKGNATQLIMKKENVPYGAALNRAKEVSGASNGSVPGASGRGREVSGRAGNRSGSRAFKRTWRSA